jgi:hypothetical protein
LHKITYGKDIADAHYTDIQQYAVKTTNN